MLQNPGASRTFYLGLGGLLTILLLLVWVTAASLSQLDAANYWNIHSYQVLVETHGMGESLFNMDRAGRDFALTGDERFLQSLTTGQADFSRRFMKVQTLTMDNPTHQEYLRQLKKAQQQWRSIYLQPLLAARRAAGDSTATLEQIRRIADQGKPYTGTLRNTLNDVEQTETTLLNERARSLATHRIFTEAFLSVGGIFAVLLVAVLSTLLARSTRHLSITNEHLHTEISKRETAMSSLHEAYVVVERTREEAERARAEAERANHAKSEFLSRMSHELCTPLNAILGFAQVLEMDEINPKQQESLQYILNGGRHLLGLINEVLDLARVEAGRLTVSSEPVPVSEVVRQACDLLKSLAAEADVQLQGCSSVATDWHVMADRQRLLQVVLNLVSNGIKYNRAGGTVSIAGAVVAGERIRIAVTDTGPGIASHDIAKLFTPFERLNATHSTVEGTGLGLALSQRLMEAMGGSLGVESMLGQGSTFWIELPVTASPLHQLEQGDFADGGLGEDGRSELEARIVLYIEDNLSNLRLIERLLARYPAITLLSAMQGRVGLDLAREHHPDLILLDLHLPDIEGGEVLRQLQANPETHGLPVVMLSADATPRQMERLLAAGARTYLTKPLDVKNFLSVLEENLKQ